MKLRVLCSSCNAVNETTGGGSINCSQCGRPFTLPVEGVIRLYRMGSPMGMAVGFGIYIDDKPCGYIGNTESLSIPIGPGRHTLYMRMRGQPTRSEVTTFTVTPTDRVFCFKVHIKTGFWKGTLVIERVRDSEMPQQ